MSDENPTQEESKTPSEDPKIDKLSEEIEFLKRRNAELETEIEQNNEEKQEMRSEMKKLAQSKGRELNSSPKGCYSDSKTRKAKLAALQAKKSKSRSN